MEPFPVTEEAIRAAAAAVRSRLASVPGLAVVLGSGLAPFADALRDARRIPFDAVPGFPRPTVPGHAGYLAVGEREGVPVIAQVGRLHRYEGHDAAAVGFPVRVLDALGVRTLILTNAAGGVNPAYALGDLMLLTDHLNLQGNGPLRGRGPLVEGRRFVDLSRPYAPRLLRIARDAALRERIPRVHEGVYGAVLGPMYETPAEVAMIRSLGADAVGMSTVPETLVARQLGMEVLGIAAIANRAASSGGPRLSHEDVLRAVSASASRVIRLLDAILPRIAPGNP